jgi:pyruvate dehydrogenase E2 component (dihydrolipoamide acetyltransferase)
VSAEIHKVGMPKWGLSMTEGKVTEWLVGEGAHVDSGAELLEIETEKIAGALESPATGLLRRHVAAVGDVVPVGGLVGVIADAEFTEEDIDAFIAEFQASFVPPETSEDATTPTETVEVDGRRLRYLRTGEGLATVVFLHGFGGDLNNWLFNSEKLAQGRTVYAVDLPGHGESVKDVGAGDLGFFAATLGAFLNAVGVDRPHLIGHSMGAAVALQLALDQPDRMASLTLIDSAGLGREINADYIDGFVNAGKGRELKSVLQLLFADQGLVTRQLVDDVLKYKRKDGVDQALRTIRDALFPDGTQAVDLSARLGELAVPVLVVWGREDRVIPVAHAERLSEGVRLEILHGQGHSPHMEAANEVNRLVGQFLEEV